MKWFLFGLLLIFNSAFGQRMKVNQKAPNFSAIDSKGDTISLRNNKGEKVFLAFFRYASCPACNFRVHELIENHDKLKAQGIQVIGVFESDNATLQDYLKETPVPFPLIGDPKLVLYKKYGVEKSFCKTVGSVFNKKTKGNLKKGKELIKDKKIKRDGSFSRIPADFIIDENGIITTAYYGENVGDHLPLEQIIKK